jgi:hypothetical protein
MRQPLDRERVLRFMRALGDRLLRAISPLEERLEMNMDMMLAAPGDFIPGIATPS